MPYSAETPRLWLEPLTVDEHFVDFWEMFNDEEAVKWTYVHISLKQFISSIWHPLPTIMSHSSWNILLEFTWALMCHPQRHFIVCDRFVPFATALTSFTVSIRLKPLEKRPFYSCWKFFHLPRILISTNLPSFFALSRKIRNRGVMPKASQK